jgi:hypothetical protein
MKRILTSGWNWFDQFYARFAKILLIVCLLTATGGVIIGTTAQIASGENGRATRSLVACLNDWSAKSSASSKAVRTASEKKDIAVTKFNATLADEGEAFLDLVESFVNPAGDHDTEQLLLDLERTLQLRADANYEVILAQNELDQAREDYPLPPAPSLYCDLTPEEVDAASLE